MIISHKYKFIFLKSTKTAGTSIEIALSKFCGEDDIITPLWPDEEKMRADKGYPTAQNWEFPIAKHHLWHRLKIRAGKTQPLFYNHVRAVEVKSYLPTEVWKSYYKFVVARNPWDRVVSQYFFDFRKGEQPPLDQYLTARKLRRINRRGWGLYTINNRIVVDAVCRYENLSEDLEKARQAIGLPEPFDLPRAKTTYRKDKPGYRELLDAKNRGKIEKIFQQEITTLNYAF